MFIYECYIRKFQTITLIINKFPIDEEILSVDFEFKFTES